MPMERIEFRGLSRDYLEQYNDMDIAVKIAGDSELLSLLWANLRRMMQASPLMDGDAYMREMENLYQQAFEDGKKV